MTIDTVLGIDTSNYTTSAALLRKDMSVVNNRKLLPVKMGERGLRQSDAVFHHVEQINDVLLPLLESNKIDLIGVSDAPRAVESSYMPCFNVGVNFAKALAGALKIDIEYFSHQQGHIAAALYSAGKLDLLKSSFIAFHVSGGTTETLLVISGDDNIPNTQIIASSLDLKAGQLIDRVGVMLGLGFPCGPELENLALKFSGTVSFKPSMKGANCSLSGIENKCRAMLEKDTQKEEIAYYCIKTVANTLELMCEKVLAEYGGLPVLFSGGVCSNTIIRQQISEKFNAHFAAAEFSSDNAVGTAILAKIKKCGLI